MDGTTGIPVAAIIDVIGTATAYVDANAIITGITAAITDVATGGKDH